MKSISLFLLIFLFVQGAVCAQDLKSETTAIEVKAAESAVKLKLEEKFVEKAADRALEKIEEKKEVAHVLQEVRPEQKLEDKKVEAQISEEKKSEENQCLENRGAMDIGSGATKTKIAKVNICEKKILEIIFEKNYPIAFKEDLSRSKDQTFSASILAELKNAIKDFKTEGLAFKMGRIKAVATEAFRGANNAKDALKDIGDEYKISADVISQEEEAEIGFKIAFSGLAPVAGTPGATSNAPVSKMMWDIGGGSMQIVIEEQGVFHRYLGKLASVSFKELVLEKIKGNKELKSPNPMTLKEIDLAIELAREEAKKIPAPIIQKIKKDSTIVGVGGVFQHSLLGQTKKVDQVAREDLMLAMNERVNFKDEDFKSNYAATDLTNLILVYGFMIELNISKVFVKKVNLTDYLFLD